MRGFAGRVAAGELDAPLAMDKRNVFGAFTESFDLMREELRRSKEGEQAAERSKRELVATLSHDIQTPISSIKAVAELMEVTADEGQTEKLKTMQSKASQIQTLVTELFQTTLEELDQLSVEPISVPSSQIAQMIKTADYQSLVSLEEFPGCLVKADPSRLAQVIDNLIANSYKYAGTRIEAAAEFDAEGLIITLRDFGSGVLDEELSRLFIKYFRGASAEGKNGYGLGLFIAHHLIERMGGRLECKNAHPGFVARIWLRLDA
jgi:signal transduction histidine kinase